MISDVGGTLHISLFHIRMKIGESFHSSDQFKKIKCLSQTKCFVCYVRAVSFLQKSEMSEMCFIFFIDVIYRG